MCLGSICLPVESTAPVPKLPHGVTDETWTGTEWEVIQGYQRHLLQLGYVDKLIGELTAKLKEAGLYDASLIIIAADHGVAFRARKKRRHITEATISDIVSIPFFIKLPGQESGVVSDRNVETIDILPTVADVLNISVPLGDGWAVDGRF